MTMTETKELPVIDKRRTGEQLAPAQIWWDRDHKWCDGATDADVVFLLLSGDVDVKQYGHDRKVWSAARFWCSSMGYMGAGRTHLFDESEVRLMQYVGSIEDVKGFTAAPAPTVQLPSSLTVREKICNCAGAVGQAKGFLQGVSTCEQLLPHQRGAAEQFAKELESRWDALAAELEQLLSQQASPPQEPE